MSDATMETAHKQPKQGNILFSGGRDEPADIIEYQKCVLTQLFQNEIYSIWDKGNQVRKKSVKKVALLLMPLKGRKCSDEGFWKILNLLQYVIVINYSCGKGSVPKLLHYFLYSSWHNSCES